MAAFSDKINKSIKEAMIAKDKVRLATLRDIKSKLILEATSGNGSEVSDEIAIKICMKLSPRGPCLKRSLVQVPTQPGSTAGYSLRASPQYAILMWSTQPGCTSGYSLRASQCTTY